MRSGATGTFPPFFATLHKRYQTPHLALGICAAVVVVFGSSGIVKFVASVSDFGYLMGLGIVNYAVIALHRGCPTCANPSRYVASRSCRSSASLSCWLFVPALEARSFLLGGALTVVGGAIYFVRPANREQLRRFPELLRRLEQWYNQLRSPRMRVLIIDGGPAGPEHRHPPVGQGRLAAGVSRIASIRSPSSRRTRRAASNSSSATTFPSTRATAPRRSCWSRWASETSTSPSPLPPTTAAT